jgi:predicted nucleic acid-binding protein
MRFWDSSALVPVLIDERHSPELRALSDDGRQTAAWWGTVVECASAIARRERSADLTADDALDALATLEGSAKRWAQVPPTSGLRDEARRIVRTHDLRAADAFQLAAARVASDGQPESLPFVTLDDRLALAARREGFPVLPG